VKGILPPYAPASIVLGSLSLAGTVVLHLTLPPDTGLYLHGGSWIYPSPLGRALGAAGGYAGLAFLTALCATLLPWVVYNLADSRGRDPLKAAWGIVKFPAAWYLFAVSIDAVAAFFLVLAMTTKSRKIALLSLAFAPMFHMALLPSALAIAAIKYLRGVAAFLAVALCGALAFSYMVATPYGVLVSRHVNFLTLIWTGAATFIVGILPVIARKLSRQTFPMDGLFLTSMVVCTIGGMEAAIQQHFQPRYCLAGAILLAAAIAPDLRSFYVYEGGARFTKDSSPFRAGMTANPKGGEKIEAHA